MRKAKIDYLVKSLDTSNNFTTVGEVKNNRIKFVDTENNTNYIVFHKDIIEYYKKGNIEMKYKFDIDNTTKGDYTLSGYKLEFDIITRKIINENNKLVIQFDLYQDKDLVNNTIIEIGYTFLEEE